MKKACFILMAMLGTAQAAEQVDLTSPYVADPRQATSFTVEMLSLDWKHKLIQIRVSDGTIARSFHYQGEQAETMMIALNKANLTSNSLHKRILDRLISDGLLSGTISGQPD